ncbi:putative ATP-dependent RNA helicase spindle-E isoform X1 [Vespula maculifrons]|uniref:Probable ATP-dependent RNA helicase spindle-E n=1 Tax=Vespula maculifrons TaxID=7453 RepID=A0ABD2CDR1_VESMC
MDYLDIFKRNKKIKKIQLPPPYSERFQPSDMSLIDNLLNFNSTTTSNAAGTNYTEEYVKKEEEELLQSAVSHISNTYGTGAKVDAVSMGSNPVIQELNNEKLTNVYRTFNFAYRPKTNLSITTMKDRIISMIDTNPVVIIEGPTGCGKTTQVPQFILDSCYKKRAHCNIIVTQPRRIAAISIAKRVSQEREWPVGTLVGYQVGMINNTSEDTRLTYCTTGVLLQKLINTKHMLEYTHIILDEIHERDQELDFLLLIVRKLLRTNSRTVKVVLMSATFNVEKFAKYFSSPVGNKLEPAPVIDIAKRTYFNINIYYLCQLGMLGPLPEVSRDEPKVTKNMMDFCVHIVIVLDELDMKADDAAYDSKAGLYNRHVILIFLPGINEIEEMHNILTSAKYENSKWDIIVLHSSITNEEQHKIFEQPPKGYRRIILSTNIAESSITVPDVKYVIDFCLVKQLVTDPKTNFQCLELSWASKGNCQQRAGRTGRIMDGRVYRLVPKTFYDSVLREEGNPEMLRAPLENLVLQAKILNMGEPKAILALSLDPPDLSNLERTILLLKESGALLNNNDKTQLFDGELTDLGRIMAALPLNIYVTKLIVLGHLFSVLRDMIIIGCSMTVKDMFCSPFGKKLLAYNVKFSWACDSESDCIAFLNVYKVWTSEKANRRLNNNAMEKRWAQRQFVQIKVLREIEALVYDVTQRLKKFGITESVGINKVMWDDEVRPFVLKIVIAGAFYPNYFIKHQNIEELKEGHKILNGLDLTNTVYLQGWPLKQPGLLYARKIQNIFQDCFKSSAGKVNVSFKFSRIYLQFSKNYTDEERKIPLSVYRSIKMRQCNMPIEVSVLSEKNALDLAKKMNLKDKSIFFNNDISIKEGKKPAYINPNLPGLDISYIPIKIINVIDPGHFWIHINDKDTYNKIRQIKKVLNEEKKSLKEFDSLPKINSLVAVPFKKTFQVEFYRGVIKNYIGKSDNKFALCQLIDIGHTIKIHPNDIRQIIHCKDIMKIPALALECVLTNIQPCTIHSHKVYWPQEANNKFHELLESNEQIFGEIYSVVNSVIALTLIAVTADKKININQILIDQELAMHKEESYLSRLNNDLRKRYENMNATQLLYYEKMQYEDYNSCDDYPDPPEDSKCVSTVRLRGPFSPLECSLRHLTIAGRDKKVIIETNSVNSVLLDSNWKEQQKHLLVAGTVSQNVNGSNLTLRNTTLIPAIPGLTALLALIFTPRMELRRNSSGTYYVGALCGLGCDSSTKESLFPERDMEIYFDVEITFDDLQDINRLRHWMNIGMHINEKIEENNNFEEIVSYQNKIKIILSKLMDKCRKKQDSEMLMNFHKWGMYDELLFLQPSRMTMVKNNIYSLHWALELEEKNDELEKMTNHIKELRNLASEDERKLPNIEIYCDFCKVPIYSIPKLRIHLYTLVHRENEKKWNIKL